MKNPTCWLLIACLAGCGGAESLSEADLVPDPEAKADGTAHPSGAYRLVAGDDASATDAFPFEFLALQPDGTFLRAERVGGPVDVGFYEFLKVKPGSAYTDRLLAFSDAETRVRIDTFVYELEGNVLTLEKFPRGLPVQMRRDRQADLVSPGGDCDILAPHYCVPRSGCIVPTMKCGDETLSW